MEYNYGKLRRSVPLQHNIAYYKRGLSELSINVTNRCPSNCCFCIRDRKPGWGEANLYLDTEPSLQEIKKAIARVLEENTQVKMAKICGYGEPILRVDILPDIISLIRQKRPSAIIQLATGGWPLYSIRNGINHFKACAKEGLDIVYLGLHATNPGSYRKKVRPMIPADEAFRRIVDFINLSRALNLQVICAFVNLGDLSIRDIREFAESVQCDYDIRDFEK